MLRVCENRRRKQRGIPPGTRLDGTGGLRTASERAGRRNWRLIRVLERDRTCRWCSARRCSVGGTRCSPAGGTRLWIETHAGSTHRCCRKLLTDAGYRMAEERGTGQRGHGRLGALGGVVEGFG